MPLPPLRPPVFRMGPLLMAPLLGACAPEVGVFGLVAEVDPRIADVVHVRWSTALPTRGAVEFGTDTAYGLRTPDEPDARTEHSATLIGLPGGTTCHLRVVSTTEGSGDQAGDDAVVTTGVLPDDLPDAAIAAPFDDGTLLLTSTITLDYVGEVVVFDAHGDVRWYWQPQTGVTSVHPLADGTGVYYVDETPATRADASITVVRFDGDAVVIPCPDCHHDAVELPDGTFATVRSVVHTIDGVRIGGDQIVVVDADGAATVVWDAFDHLTVVENSGWDAGQLPGAADWTHANGIAYDPAVDTFFVTMYGPETVVAVDRGTGATRWILGGPDNELAGRRRHRRDPRARAHRRRPAPFQQRGRLQRLRAGGMDDRPHRRHRGPRAGPGRLTRQATRPCLAMCTGTTQASRSRRGACRG